MILTMIVKNEAHCVGRAIRSAAPHVDAAVIVDTGSTDDTLKVIGEITKELGLACHVFKRPWKDFSTNRNEALNLAWTATAHGEQPNPWALLLDADEELTTLGTFPGGRDAHEMWNLWHEGRTRYLRPGLIRLGRWQYQGKVHEELVPTEPRTYVNAVAEGSCVVDHWDSARNRSGQHMRAIQDIAMLEQQLEEGVAIPRTLFYLAQSHLEAGSGRLAHYYYQLRADEQEGWDEERWYAMLMVARLSIELGYEHRTVLACFNRAFNARPQRAETLVHLANYLQACGSNVAAAVLCDKARRMSVPDDALNVDLSCYTR
jgi:glycosyltransferase involved in cell wall biosynthesis